MSPSVTVHPLVVSDVALTVAARGNDARAESVSRVARDALRHAKLAMPFAEVLLLLILLVMLIYNRAKGSCESRNRRTWSFGPSPQGTAYGRGVYSALGSRYTPPSLP
ncbi:unnamed protein product [Durusdinium trenchii]|uniref:Uncharacterized protein n=1 Tax=Durusdinium trenchii TaxID=1381693 RepID=A0ABP0N163_9DINO